MPARHPSSVLLPERSTHECSGLTPSVPKSIAKGMMVQHQAFVKVSVSPEDQRTGVLLPESFEHYLSCPFGAP